MGCGKPAAVGVELTATTPSTPCFATLTLASPPSIWPTTMDLLRIFMAFLSIEFAGSAHQSSWLMLEVLPSGCHHLLR
uniref:Aldo-keto reductase n=1 Tax=Rhizophora mucronata TaxID=61149 RepID=A0A2P2K7H6_RHIMU